MSRDLHVMYLKVQNFRPSSIDVQGIKGGRRVKGVVAGSIDFGCSGIFYWNQRIRKPRSNNFGSRHP